MLTGYLRQRRRTLLAFFLFGGIFAAAFALYQLPLRAVAPFSTKMTDCPRRAAAMAA